MLLLLTLMKYEAKSCHDLRLLPYFLARNVSCIFIKWLNTETWAQWFVIYLMNNPYDPFTIKHKLYIIVLKGKLLLQFFVCKHLSGHGKISRHCQAHWVDEETRQTSQEISAQMMCFRVVFVSSLSLRVFQNESYVYILTMRTFISYLWIQWYYIYRFKLCYQD